MAVWWRSRGSVRWDIDLQDHGRSAVRNAGEATARDVHVRAGSASDESNIEAEARAASLAHGEVIRIVIAPTYGSAKDYAIVVTWKGPFGRRKRWTYQTH